MITLQLQQVVQERDQDVLVLFRTEDALEHEVRSGIRERGAHAPSYTLFLDQVHVAPCLLSFQLTSPRPIPGALVGEMGEMALAHFKMRREPCLFWRDLPSRAAGAGAAAVHSS